MRFLDLVSSRPLAEIVNINKARKQKAHLEKQGRASQNRYEYGQLKQDKIKAKIKLAQERQNFDGKMHQPLPCPSEDSE